MVTHCAMNNRKCTVFKLIWTQSQLLFCRMVVISTLTKRAYPVNIKQKYEQQKLYKIQTLPNQCTNLYPVCRKVENKTLPRTAYPVNSKETSKLSSGWRHIKRFTANRQPWISLLTSSQIYIHSFKLPLLEETNNLTFNSFMFNLTIRIYWSA